MLKKSYCLERDEVKEKGNTYLFIKPIISRVGVEFQISDFGFQDRKRISPVLIECPT